MAVTAIAAAAAQLPTVPTLQISGQVGWSGGTGPAATGALPAAAATATDGAAAVGGPQSFGQNLTSALERLQATQTKADGLATQAATGDLTNVHDYMIAATEASLAIQLTVAVRNKAVEAFNQIMHMAV